MKLLKPAWVNHDGKAIFAIDIHPDGSRFATGGQGEDCGLVVIWNVAPVVSEDDGMNENVPKMLCQLDDHTGCVNCIRWSNSGKYLASGGDDKMVMIWQLSRTSGSSTAFGTGGAVVNIENWRCSSILRGHSGDILDLAWSPDDNYVATGSVDNTIIVWNAQKFPEIQHVIEGHHGLVKGITFDPVGKYMASQSDDKSLCIWNVNDWSLEKKITEPFLESSGTTHALRLNWSPDGQYIVSAHAMNNGGPVAKIIERNGWKAKMDFVGHRKAITCIRFNNRLLTSGDIVKKHQYVCSAIGSRDRSLSIWITSLKRPLVVLHDLFDNSIMDISWSHCGYFLLACSLDGTVAYCDFTKEEIGKVMSTEDKFIYHKKTYGTSIKSSKSLITSSILENTDFLKYQQQQNEERIKKAKLLQQNLLASNSGVISPVGKNSSTPFKTDGIHTGGLVSSNNNDKTEATQILKQQKETKTKEGKRRIVPMLLEPPADFEDDFVKTTDNLKNNDMSFSSDIDMKVSSASQLGSAKPTPILILSTLPKSSSPSKSKSCVSCATATTTTSSISVKRKLDISEPTSCKKTKKKKEKEKKSHDSSVVKESSINDSNLSTMASDVLVRLPYPQPENKLSIQVNLPSLKQQTGKATLEVENDLSSGSSFHYLRCIIEDALSWETCLTSPVTALATNQYIICVSCQNNTVHVFSTKGRRLVAGMVVDSHISQLQCHKHYLMVISSSANISLWNVKNKTSIISKESLLPILKGADQSVTHSFINNKGCPVVTLSDHSVYTYDPHLLSWTHLASACESLQLTADIGSCLTGVLPKGPLHSVQAPLNRLSKQMMRGLRMNQTKQQTSTFAYLESQVCAALSIDSAEEYHFWLMTYARYIVQSGEENRLRDLCEDLLGPVLQGKNENNMKWQPKILCYDKRDLLKDIMPIIASNLLFQRFYTEFQQQLELLSKR